MPSLFNSYQAYTDEGQEIATLVDRFVDTIIDDYPHHPICEIEAICIATIVGNCGYHRILFGINKRKAERRQEGDDE
jgi:UDP-N-acetylmuramate-alanine ligase